MRPSLVPVTVKIHRIPNLSFSIHNKLKDESKLVSSFSNGYSIKDYGENPSFIGEKVQFAVIIENRCSTSIRIHSIDSIIVTGRNKIALEEESVSSSSETKNLNTSSKLIEIPPNTCYSLRYSKLIYEVGTQTVKVKVVYKNDLMEFIASAEYQFTSVKPFDLVFARNQHTDSSYIVNTTITNRLSTPLSLLNVYMQLPSTSRELYNSFTQPQHLQPKMKYTHLSIVECPLQKDASIGSLAIQFTAPGHGIVGLNSTAVKVFDVSNASIRGYYETDGNFTPLKIKQIMAVITNISDMVQIVNVDWSKTQSSMQIIGECRFNKILQPGKTMRIALDVLPLIAGNSILEPPIVNGGKDNPVIKVAFAALPVNVQ